ncbi:MAG: DUF551 domain-containing protein [Oscillospiraceae bacterium]|nr:DUF551 domain-containing protein [Oscillospiraceae bacterium]
MYDELIKNLRVAGDFVSLSNYQRDLMREAADAIEELSKPSWIPVTERLPEEKTYVLILFDTIAGKMQGVCFLYKDDDGHNCWTWLDRLGKNLFDIQPTHWMPLPSTDGLNET